VSAEAFWRGRRRPAHTSYDERGRSGFSSTVWHFGHCAPRRSGIILSRYAMTAADDAEGERCAQHEIALLEGDVRLVMKVMIEELQRQPVDSPTGDHGNYFAVTGDLWRRLCEFCLNVALILRHGAYSPDLVVARTAYELAVNLLYVIKQGDRVRNGVLFRTRSLLEVADVFRDEPSGAEAVRILAKVPGEVVKEAEGLKKKRKSWCGKSISEMAKAVGVEGHGPLYAVQSWEAHGRIAGYDVEEIEKGGDLRRFKFESKRKPKEVEALALFMRRILHLVYWTVAKDWLGKLPTLPTTNPFEEEERK